MGKGLGLSETARRANVSPATLSYWESGRRNPSGGALDSLLKVLEVGVRDRARLLVLADPAHARIALLNDPLGPPVDQGQILRAMRLRRGMTQSGLAARAGVTQSAVAKWETGDSIPDATTLHGVLFELGASVEEVLAITAATPGPPQGEIVLEERVYARPPLPYALRELAHLGLEADLWKRAVRDPKWERPLVQSMAERTHHFLSDLRHGEIEPLARRTFRLAAASGAWSEATGAFFALAPLRRERGMMPAEYAVRIGRWLERTTDRIHRQWALSIQARALAASGEMKRALEINAQAVELHAFLHPSHDHDVDARFAIGEIHLAVRDADAVLDSLGSFDHPYARQMCCQALVATGQVPPEAWSAQYLKELEGPAPLSTKMRNDFLRDLERARQNSPGSSPAG